MTRPAASLAAFIGTTPNIGTTVAAFATAYRIAEASGKPIGYLCLHLKSAKIHRYLGVDEPVMTLDKLQPDMRSGTLTPDKLHRACYSLPHMTNLRVLFGNMPRDQAEFYTPEEIEHLLLVAEQLFALVILDFGAYWDNAATVCSIRRASSRLLVTTAALSHFQEDGRHWIGQLSPLFNVPPNQYDCLIATYPWGNGGYHMKQISKELGAAPLSRFQLSESLFNGLDSGNYAEWLRRDTTGRVFMKDTAKTLMTRHCIQGSFAPIASQPWYRKLMTHRNGVGS